MAESKSGGPVRVLLIDDDKDLRAGVKLVLEMEGFQVSAASSGAEGLEMAAMAPPDVIVLDVEMPVMDGPETLRELRRNASLDNSRVIFLTGKVDLDAMEETFLDVAQGYLLKPFGGVDLLNKIEEVLGIGE
jgi:DNA-binding response OmpR family regulator